MHVFARNEAANKWLAEHPLVLGIGAFVIGLILIGLGVRSLVTGKAPSKFGPDVEGGYAKVLAFFWIGMGALCLLFAIFKIASGLL